MTAYGYARVSTQDQHLDAQLAQLAAAGCTHVYQEKASGADDARPQLAALMGVLRPGDSVAITKLDRIARSTKHLLQLVEDLERMGVALRILNIAIDTGTPTGKLMLTVIGAIAQFEREMMLERQRDGIALARLMGKYKGRAPSARSRADELRMLLDGGMTRQAAAKALGIGVASVYRILAEKGVAPRATHRGSTHGA